MATKGRDIAIYIYVYVPKTCRANYRVEKKSAAAIQAAVRDSHPEVGWVKSRCKPDLFIFRFVFHIRETST